MERKRFALHWEVAPVEDVNGKPQRFVPAQVPGAVQLDWARANGLAFPEYAGNMADYRWMEDSYWLYRATLDYPAPESGESAFFTCGGIDYQFQIRIDGKAIYKQEGMFTPIDIDLSDKGKPGSLLEVLVFPAPKSHQDGDDRFQADRSVKPAVSYGWDFHPRLIPLGIWEETAVEIRPSCYLRQVETHYRLNEQRDAVNVTWEVRLSQMATAILRWRLLNSEGETVLRGETPANHSVMRVQGQLSKPRLWWPNGQGEAALYTSIVELVGENGMLLDAKEMHIGFRTIHLVMHTTQWDDPDVSTFPLGPNKPPVTLEVNGRSIFAKGSNWVSPDIFPGRINAATYQPLLALAKEAYFNLLRCWGGAIVQKEAFFDQCDALGLMVWQEFPLSCVHYEGEHYLEVLDQESRSIIQRLRGHPSVAFWCGGNELFNSWSRMTEQDLAIRLLNRNTFDLDPERAFINTSPLYGMGHGFYVFVRPDGKEVFQYVPEAHCTAYDEFGVPGPASVDLLKRIIPAEELFPPKPTPAWIERHGWGAWDGSATSWLEYPTLVKYFGEPGSLEEMVEAGQCLQSEGLKFFFEETRRQKPVCAMGLNWCFNEPWPTAANGSLVSWPAEPKPAMAAVKEALRPILASARPSKFSWRAGEMFTADVFLLNDAPEALPAGTIKAMLVAGDQEFSLLNWSFLAVKANTNLTGPAIRFKLPELGVKRFKLVLRVARRPELDSEYTFLFG